jgi:alkyl sulfatase BDS1-like metallo-beta-lactamase superfamily hydrolase
MSLGTWAARSPSLPSDAPVGADSIALALRSRFDPDAAKGLRARYELRLGEDRFRVEISEGELELTRGAADHPNATIDTDPGTLAAVLWDGRPLAEMTIEGDRAAVKRFVRLFPMPEVRAPTLR